MISCTCIKDTEKKVKESFMDKENICEVTELSIDNTAFMFTEGGCQTQLYSPMVIKYDYKNKKGELKHKKEKVNMAYNYCPFCGKPYKK